MSEIDNWLAGSKVLLRTNSHSPEPVAAGCREPSFRYCHTFLTQKGVSQLKVSQSQLVLATGV